MKKLLRLFPLLLLFALGTSCTEDDPYSGLSINGGARFLSLDALSRSGNIAVQSPSPWTVKVDPADDWFTLSAQSGPEGYSQIEITLDANPGPARSAVLSFACCDATTLFTLSQAAAQTGFDAPQYYFYAAFGTLPALYSGLHLLSHDKPSYFFYERPRTFDPAQFPSYATPLTAENRNNPLSEAETRRIADKIKERVLKINAEQPTAVFGFYVTDLACRLGYDWFVAQGIDSTRVKVTMLSDGTGTYNHFFNSFGNAATAEQNWNAYAEQVNALNWNHGGRYPETRAPQEYLSSEWCFYLAQRPNYRLMLQNGDLLESSGPFMTAQLNKMKIESVQPYELLEALPESAREQFYRMAEFDYAKFEALFDASPKENLVIIGTSHSSPQSEQQQADYVARIVAQYGERYDLFFKPHPADGSSAGYPDRFAGLQLLPGQMPFEIFLWALLDKVDLIGGYPSTVFLSVPLDKVGFLFAPDAASLVSPLNLLFRDATNVEWIQ